MVEMETIAISRDGVSVTMLFAWLVSRGIDAIKVWSLRNDEGFYFMLSVDRESASRYANNHPYQEINVVRKRNVVHSM